MTPRCALRIAVASIAGLTFGCHLTEPSKHQIRAKAGIFYGGQIQNRTEWPLVLDATRQTQGFRIEFAQPLSKPAQVHWNLTRSNTHPKKRTTLHDETGAPPSDVLVPVGSQRFDQVIPFSDSDRPGEWRLKIAVDGASVLDTTIHVVPKPAVNAED